MKWNVLVTVGVTVFAFAALSASDAQAQRRVGRYQSASGRPTITPYLDYFRNEPFSFGVRDSYNQFVRPNRQMRETLQRQQTGITNLQTQVQQVERDVENATSVREIGIGPTGHSATFMNYSGYYNLGGRR